MFRHHDRMRVVMCLRRVILMVLNEGALHSVGIIQFSSA